MTMLLDVVLRPPQPTAEEKKELLPSLGEIRRMELTKDPIGLVTIHVVVEEIRESTDGFLAAHGDEGRALWIEGHDSTTPSDVGGSNDVDSFESVARTTPATIRTKAVIRRSEGGRTAYPTRPNVSAVNDPNT